MAVEAAAEVAVEAAEVAVEAEGGGGGRRTCIEWTKVAGEVAEEVHAGCLPGSRRGSG